jgi:hypothetical protein
MEVAVEQAVAIGKRIELIGGEARDARRHERVHDLRTYAVLQRHHAGRRDDVVKLRLRRPRDRAGAPRQPRLPAEKREQVRPIDTLHDQAGAAIDLGAAEDRRHERHDGARRLHSRGFVLDRCAIARAAEEAQDGAALPLEDLRLAALGDLAQAAGRGHRAESMYADMRRSSH